MDFLHPPNQSGYNRQLLQMLLPPEKLGEQAGLATRPEGHRLGPRRETTLPPPSFLSSSSATTMGALHPRSTISFSKDLIYFPYWVLKINAVPYFKTELVCLGKHCNPLQRVTDLFAVISQTQSVVCCNSPVSSLSLLTKREDWIRRDHLHRNCVGTT